MSKLIYAPWTDEQVAALNRWQDSDYVHPFTCGTKEKHVESKALNVLGDDLLATNAGWICPFCDYTQNWAHDFMLEPPPIPPWERNKPKEST